MRAFAYQTPKGEPRVGIQIDGKNYNFTYMWQIFKELKNSPSSPDIYFLQIIIEMENFSKTAFMEVFNTVQEMRGVQDLVIKTPIEYQVPIPRPEKIICLGRNYVAHAEEWNSDVPTKPLFFGKLPSSLLPNNGIIRFSKGIGRVDHELELAVVIGKTAKNVSEEDAMDHVAGYTIVNDVTARGMQLEDIKNGKPWTLSKGFDTFCPIGPFLIPADAVKDPHNLNMELTVNDVVKQKANTKQLVFKIPQVIAYISQFITFQPGDIICTGTPEGTLPIVNGDVVEAKIDGFGVLRNTVQEF